MTVPTVTKKWAWLHMPLEKLNDGFYLIGDYA